MKITFAVLALSAGAATLLVACNTYEAGDSDLVGEVEVALTNAPSDVTCLTIKVTGERTDRRSFDVKSGEKQVYRMRGLPVGKVNVSADAFGVTCRNLTENATPTWYSESQVSKIRADQVTQLALSMIHNGQAAVAVDFDESNGATSDLPGAPSAGAKSSAASYLIPSIEGVRAKAILSAGDAANATASDSTYRMVGVPDGLGAFDNGDGTFTLVANHELTASAGAVRAHGAKGSFVSKWTIRKTDLAVLSGADLIQKISLWDEATSSYKPEVQGVALSRLCSADLPPQSALFSEATNTGFDQRLLLSGEENGAEGRAFAHELSGTSYELPRLGKASWENIVMNPGPATSTLVAALDDSSGGQVYFYLGQKTSFGRPIERAGLTNGKLLGLRVQNVIAEDPELGITTARFELHDFGNLENTSGAALEVLSDAEKVTKFQRPEDGAWDPVHPSHFYFVTTASFTSMSRLWRVKFDDRLNPEFGGSIEMLLQGTEGHAMLDNMTIDQLGHVYLQEDVGNNARLGKVWRYEIATDSLTEILHFDPERFQNGAPNFLTEDEESSGVIDASTLLGPGWFLSSVQVHSALDDAELVEGGQLVAFFDPGASN